MSKEAICGNLTSIISDHLPQFLIMLSNFSDTSSSKPNVYERGSTNFNKEEFIWTVLKKTGILLLFNLKKKMMLNIPLTILLEHEWTA